MSASESAVVRSVERVRGTRIQAWVAWLVPSALTAVGLIVLLATRDAPYPADAWGFRGYSALFALTTATVGAVVIAHQPRNRIGQLWIVLALLTSLTFLAEEYVAYGVLAHPGSLPAVEWVAWVLNWLWIPAFTIMVVFFLVFPDGRPLTRRWWAVAWLALIAGLMNALLAAIVPGPLPEFSFVQNPLPIGEPSQYGGVFLLARLGLLASLLLAAWSLVLRYRRADTTQRLQLRWVAYAVTIAALVAPLGFLSEEWGQALFVLALCGLPVAGGIAILRYRLYEIDFLINRTLVYASLTAILAGIYAASVVLVQRTFMAVTGEGSDAAFVITTLVVVVAITPAKNALQALVDRHFKDHTSSTASLVALTGSLQDRLWAVDPEVALCRLLDVSVDAFEASGGSVRLAGRSISQVGEWPIEPALTSARGDAGAGVTLAIGRRASGRPYSEDDRKLLDEAVGALAAAIGARHRSETPLAADRAVHHPGIREGEP